LKGRFYEVVAGETLYSEPSGLKPYYPDTIKAQILWQHEVDHEFEDTLRKFGLFDASS
jgi:hypothetical protein